MAWPKRRRLRVVPLLLGLALLAALAAALALDRDRRLLDLRAAGVPVLFAAWALAPALLAWGLSGLVRRRWLLLPLCAGSALFAFAALLAVALLAGHAP